MSKRKLFVSTLRRWGFIIGLTVLFLIAGAVVYFTFEFRGILRSVAHTNSVLKTLGGIEVMVERAEGSQRGFLITRRTKFLRPYHTIIDNVQKDVDVLHGLIKDSPSQIERARHLNEVIKERFTKMQNTLELAEREPLNEIASRMTVDTMLEIRKTLNEMEDEEGRLLALREETSQNYAVAIYLLLIGGGTLGTAILIFSALLARQSSQVARAHTNLIESILTNLSEGLIVIDGDMRVIHHNRAAEEMLEIDLEGISLREMYEGIQALNPLSGHRRPYQEAALYQSVKGQKVERFEVRVGRDGQRLLTVDSRPVVDENGRTIAALAVFSDITKRRETEEGWIAAREAAIEASRLKSEYLANMSHEIRTPMNGVLGMSTLLLETKLDADQLSYVKAIKTSADGLLGLINQVLDHAKIESGKLTLVEADFALEEALENVVSPFLYLSRTKGVDLRFEVAPDVPALLHGDVSRLRQILVNLVGNALKFTEKGYVSIRVEKLSSEEGRVELRFNVQDTGSGIALHLQKQLFEKFSQVHEGRKVGGSGLGLMISKQLAHVMGGEIGVESAPGFGSRFWFTVKLGEGTAADSCELKPRRAKQKLSGQILVAEDQPINQLVIRKFLENFGLTCTIVEDGEAAIKAVRERHVDLVLMDCQMEPVDGYAAAEEIRKFKSKEELPILALTAEGVSGDRIRCLEVGMNEVLNKPIDIDHLYQRLSQYLKVKPAQQEFEFDDVQLEKLADYSAGDRPLIDVLADDFFTQGRELVNQVKDSARAGETENMRDFAHALKSPASTLGLKALAKVCTDLEENSYSETELAAKLSEMEKYFNNGCAWLSSRQRTSKAS